MEKPGKLGEFFLLLYVHPARISITVFQNDKLWNELISYETDQMAIYSIKICLRGKL